MASLIACTGEFLYFLDDDNALKPHALSTLLRAAVASGAHILTTPNEKWPSLEPPPTADAYDTELWLPLGGSAALGIVRNCFGDAAALVSRAAVVETSVPCMQVLTTALPPRSQVSRAAVVETSVPCMQVLTTALLPRSQVSRAAFEELGGFTEDVGVGHEDWELWALAVLRGYVLQVSATECHRVPPSATECHRVPPSLHAVLRGYVLQVVPEALYWYRIGPGRGGAMLGDSLGSTARARAQRQANLARSLRPYRAALGSWPEGRAVLQLAQSLEREPPPS